jgi:prophage maintenance system killer protein
MSGSISWIATSPFSRRGSIRASPTLAEGNKRTAFRAAVAFVEINGYDFEMPQQPHAIARLLGYFDGKLGQSGVVEWFRLWMTPR